VTLRARKRIRIARVSQSAQQHRTDNAYHHRLNCKRLEFSRGISRAWQGRRPRKQKVRLFTVAANAELTKGLLQELNPGPPIKSPAQWTFVRPFKNAPTNVSHGFQSAWFAGRADAPSHSNTFIPQGNRRMDTPSESCHSRCCAPRFHCTVPSVIKNEGLRDELEKPTTSIKEIPQSHGFNKARTAYTPGGAQRKLPTPIIKVYVLAARVKIQANHDAALVFIRV
jgi:hypothetical protein